MIELVEAQTSDGKSVVGFASRPDGLAKIVLLHVHGYGGDGFSNRFVRHMHQVLPALGIAFVSFQMRTSGYIIEQYSDASVEYVGSALVDPREAAKDVCAMAKRVAVFGERVICQGHSFGTNLVKYCLSEGFISGPAVFISPADSRSLQVAFEEHRCGTCAAESGLSWSVFGIHTEGISYPIPIDAELFSTMRNGPVFGAWSAPIMPVDTECLVVRGSEDGISKIGLTASADTLRDLVPNMELVELPTASHVLHGCEAELASRVASWAQSLD